MRIGSMLLHLLPYLHLSSRVKASDGDYLEDTFYTTLNGRVRIAYIFVASVFLLQLHYFTSKLRLSTNWKPRLEVVGSTYHYLKIMMLNLRVFRILGIFQ